MSEICVIVNLDGAPADAAALQRMAEAARHRGSGEINYVVEGSVGFAHNPLNTTPESLREHQPLRSADGSLWLAADARVDNRQELIHDLGARGYVQEKDPTDADLILAAYQCWGAECPARIIGDFAFVIWDAAQRRLFCARDAIGIRPLHYCQVGQRIFVASAVGAIVAGLGARPPINYALLQDFIAGEFERWTHETAYKEIYRIPPAYCLMVRSDDHSWKRYWTLGAQDTANYRRDVEYVERFRELFEESVRVRLRSSEPIGIRVSGGLDSSSIACLTDHLVESGLVSVSAKLYSSVFEDTPGADERMYLEAVLRKCDRLEAILVPGDDCWALREFGDDDDYPLDEPEIDANRLQSVKGLRRAYGDGCRVIMSGHGGDQILRGDAYYVTALLKGVSLLRLPAELPHFARCSGHSISSLLISEYVRPFLRSRGIARIIRKVVRRGAVAEADDGFLSGPSQEALAWPEPLPLPRLSTRSAEMSYHHLTRGAFSALLVHISRLSRYMGIEWRLPYLDRRVIDFVLAAPSRLLFRNGLDKYVLREAMAGILPAAVRGRINHAHFGELYVRGLHDKERARVHDLQQNSRIARLGLVNEQRLLAVWDSYWRGSPSGYGLTRSLARTLMAEAWLRSLEKDS
jgi:asparagine synthase (glutamine-hydrolysing)